MNEVKRRKEGIMHPSPLVFLSCRMLHMKNNITRDMLACVH